jgi:hypothetical protein
MSLSTPDVVRSLMVAMSPNEQEQVLEFARSLAQAKLPPPTPIANLLRFAGRLPPEVAEEMLQALDDMERIEDDNDDLSF